MRQILGDILWSFEQNVTQFWATFYKALDEMLLIFKRNVTQGIGRNFTQFWRNVTKPKKQAWDLPRGQSFSYAAARSLG